MKSRSDGKWCETCCASLRTMLFPWSFLNLYYVFTQLLCSSEDVGGRRKELERSSAAANKGKKRQQQKQETTSKNGTQTNTAGLAGKPLGTRAGHDAPTADGQRSGVVVVAAASVQRKPPHHSPKNKKTKTFGGEGAVRRCTSSSLLRPTAPHRGRTENAAREATLAAA